MEGQDTLLWSIQQVRCTSNSIQKYVPYCLCLCTHPTNTHTQSGFCLKYVHIVLLIFPPYLLIRYGHALSVNVEGQDTLHAHTHTDTYVCSTHMHTHDGAEDGDRDIGLRGVIEV